LAARFAFPGTRQGKTGMLHVRSILFYIGYVIATVFWGTLSCLVAWILPFRGRFVFVIVYWTRIVLWWLRVTCGITHRISGAEHIPARAGVALSKHQSTWETLFLQSLFVPQTTVLKRELLHIPFFGWAFRLLKPIAIDRGNRSNAYKQLLSKGKERLAEGAWVVLFPEGTRIPPGKTGTFQRGGAALAVATECPLLVVAHNAGLFWPPRRLVKQPGIIDVVISPLIETRGRSADEVNREARAWLEKTTGRLEDQTSRLATESALVSMKSRRGST
jgi:1-acyl-sn-glycerol-3-phosphate acyltransferase